MSGFNLDYTPPGPVAEAFHESDDFVRVLFGPVGCLPGNSEYLSPAGWKRMDEYDGGLVGVWGDGVVSFERPEFISAPAADFIRFDSGSLAMELSDAHRVPHFAWDGKFGVKTAAEIAKRPSRRLIPTTFSLSSSDADISDDLIRFRVMFSADGYVPAGGKKVAVCVRKDRKKIRLREMLTRMGIEWVERSYDYRPTEVTFAFEAPTNDKSLSFLWGLSTRQLGVALEECEHWDGLHDHEEARYYSTIKENADAIQFAAHACGLRASIRVQAYDKENWKDGYTVGIRRPESQKNKAFIRETTKISRIPASDGKQYCFTTSTGFFVARCEDKIFVTGNSGKSATCCIEMFNRALQQAPSADKVRRTRFCAIRNTYAELKSTTIKTYQDWFSGIETTRWDTPIVSTISLPDLGDGTSLHMEVLFIALDRPEDAGKLRSLELTMAWLNEASLLDKAVLDIATQRVGRYPSLSLHGGPSFSGVILDTNMPDDDSWLYKLAEEDKPEGFSFFKQPGGIYKVLDKKSPDYGKYKPNPLAENIKNLAGGHSYYLKQIAGKSDDYIRVFLEGLYGTTMQGRPVYPEFVDKVHVSDKPLAAIPGLPIVLSFDFGLTPACIITQMNPRGQVMVLDEIVCENMGIRTAYLDCVLPVLNAKYSNFRIEAVGDPAGVARAPTDEKSCFEELEDLGLWCEPTSTNKFLPRKDAVAFFLQRLTSSGPGMLIDPSCRVLIKGFRGGFMYDRLQVSGESRFKDRPAKNRFSHPHDALQYGCLHHRGESQQVVSPEIQQVAWA